MHRQPGPKGRTDLSPTKELTQRERAVVKQFAGGDDRKGFLQVLTILVPLPALWWGVAWSATVSYWLTAGVTLLMSLFLVRAFVLMHDCGHGSLFRSPRLNRFVGFVFGVFSGMPQYVWSNHHAYHHATNGNWDRYRGALLTKSLAEFEALSGVQRRLYALLRTLWMTPLHGFLYVLFFPRVTWFLGSLRLLAHVTRRKLAEPGLPFRACAAGFQTPYWKSAKEYWHMFGNNLVLLSAWLVMSLLLGPALFFSVYVSAVSLAAAMGIVLFAVQHNFEHSYASGDEGWDSEIAAIEGTSCLVLPRWLNWFTADIAYHHVHHLSSAIPNYRLRDCHREFAELFAGVRRIALSDIPAAYRCNLWDTRARRIISVAEYLEQKVAVPVPS
jgi:acyl-lipid omega-6 desaturase (Delta-12 desaturase)